jgi:hypothetical protein
MAKNYNSQAFTPEEVQKGLHLDLIKYLLDYNSKAEGFFNDIHIDSDGYCVIIEWVQESYKDACTGFEFVDCDEEILKIVHYPDNSYGYASSEDEANDMLLLWLHENPGWKKNNFGHWYKPAENIELIKEILD